MTNKKSKKSEITGQDDFGKSKAFLFFRIKELFRFNHKKTKVFISGSISLKVLDIQAIAYLDLLIANRYTVLIGDAFGIDKAVQQYLFRHAYKSVIVYYSGDIIRNNIGNWRTKHIKNKNLRTGKEMYRLKDEAMALDADCGLVIWDNKSPGTKYNTENMKKLDKPVIVLKNMNIHPDIFKQYLETGKRMDKRYLLSLLIDMYMDYCGISLGYRTVVYDFGWAVFKQYAMSETTEFSGEEAFCNVMGQINPAYTEEYDEYDIGIIKMENYSVYCVEISEEYNDERCAALCYAFTCWVKETCKFPYIRRHDLLYRLYNVFLRKFRNRKTIKKRFVYDNRDKKI